MEKSNNRNSNTTAKNEKTTVELYEEMTSIDEQMINISLRGSIMNVSLMLDDLMSGKWEDYKVRGVGADNWFVEEYC